MSKRTVTICDGCLEETSDRTWATEINGKCGRQVIHFLLRLLQLHAR